MLAQYESLLLASLNVIQLLLLAYLQRQVKDARDTTSDLTDSINHNILWSNKEDP